MIGVEEVFKKAKEDLGNRFKRFMRILTLQCLFSLVKIGLVKKVKVKKRWDGTIVFPCNHKNYS